jgi:hypothetical protein
MAISRESGESADAPTRARSLLWPSTMSRSLAESETEDGVVVEGVDVGVPVVGLGEAVALGVGDGVSVAAAAAAAAAAAVAASGVALVGVTVMVGDGVSLGEASTIEAWTEVALGCGVAVTVAVVVLTGLEVLVGSTAARLTASFWGVAASTANATERSWEPDSMSLPEPDAVVAAATRLANSRMDMAVSPALSLGDKARNRFHLVQMPEFV